MYLWTNKFPFSIQTTLLFTVSHLIPAAESASNALLPVTGDACPGDVLTYTCTIVGSGNTIWSGSAFECETKMNEIILRHSQFNKSGTFGNCNDGAVRTRSIGVVNDDCYSSQLNITVTSDMHSKTIRCSHSSNRIVKVGEITLSIATAPPSVRLAEVHPGQLIFDWRASTDHLTGLNHIIESNCGNCPNMTNTTMVTCSDLNVSTTLTMCTFSVRNMACGTVGGPSLPIVVNLGVPVAPDVMIIPQYSATMKSLERIILHVEQNVTSFSIADKISGSVVSYSIFYSGTNVGNLSACIGSTCTYTMNISSSFCSNTPSTDIDVAIASANRLGEGQPSEPTFIECKNQFVNVVYYPETTTIACTFGNESDMSLKWCRIEYGTCDQDSEKYVTEGNATDGHIMLQLNLSAMDPKYCYVITASNDTFTVMVTGDFEIASKGGSMSTAVIAVIVAILAILVAGLSSIVIISIATILLFLRARRRRSYADQQLIKTQKEQQSLAMNKMKESDDFVPISIHAISSAQFMITELDKDRKVGKLKSTYGKYIFVECDQVEEGEREKVIDIILKSKTDGNLSSGPDAQCFIGQKQVLDSSERVFVLSQLTREEVIPKGKYILHQNPNQKKQSRFRVLRVDKDTTVSEFLSQKGLELEKKMIFRQFPPEGIDLHYYHDVLKVPSSKRKLLEQFPESPKDELTLSASSTGIEMFYDLKLRASGRPPSNSKGYFIQITKEDSRCSLNVGSFILVYKDPDEHVQSTTL